MQLSQRHPVVRTALCVSLLLACSSDPAKPAGAADDGTQSGKPDGDAHTEAPGSDPTPPPAGTGGPAVAPSANPATRPDELIGPDTSDEQGTCGDGVLDDDEACDDGNQLDGDGCESGCGFIEQGFVCKPSTDDSAQSCIPFTKCGDGMVSFPEQCDDAGLDAGDGCDATCKLEIGFKCSGEPSTCEPTACGDGLVEGTELCEPSSDAGCTSQCQFAPDCSGDGACTSACGDGILLNEACDDGNTLPGDGCDEHCEIEPGYSCELQMLDCERSEVTGECILRVPVTYRDFDDTHSDFESECGGTEPTLGLVEPALVAKKPVATVLDMCTSGFAEWYEDGDASTTYRSELVLFDDGEGNYVNRYGDDGEPWYTTLGTFGGVDCTVAPHCGPFDGNPFFFPIDGIPDARADAYSIAEVATVEYGIEGLYSEQELTGMGPEHNFSFTSEVEYWFPYDENTNATLRFTGDDDVWVFINDQLALDLGGLHPAVSGEVVVSGTEDHFLGGTESAHLMTPGNVYPIKVFHAERHTTGSTFKLTFSGFVPARSSCNGECGNGSVEYGEECDDGELNADEYNHCGTDCRLTEYCGDGQVTHDEDCDDAIDDECHGCRKLVVR